MILHHWINSSDGTTAEFVIHDSDKNIIRDNVVEGVIVSANLIRLTQFKCYMCINGKY